MRSMIVIPSRGRPKVPTFWALPPVLRKRTTLVIRRDEEGLYEDVPATKVLLPPRVEGLSATRQWILDNINSRFVMQLDDDFSSFNYKPRMDDWALRRLNSAGVLRMFELVDYWITAGGFAHAGIMDRIRSAHPSDGGLYETNRLCAQFLAYDTRVLKGEKLRFDRVLLSQDKDMCLQLLELGYANRVSRRYSYNCAAPDTSGGCATYRTEKLRREQSDLLKSLHPEGVIRQRTKRVKSKNLKYIFRAKNYVNWRKAFNSRISERRMK